MPIWNQTDYSEEPLHQSCSVIGRRQALRVQRAAPGHRVWALHLTGSGVTIEHQVGLSYVGCIVALGRFKILAMDG